MSEPTQDFHQPTVDHIARPANEAWKQAEAIAADSRYNEKHKADEIDKLHRAALSEVDTRYRETNAELEARIANLKQKATYQPVLASEVDIMKLNYVRDALQVQWAGANIEALRDGWQAALAANDLIAVKVYRDFSLPFFRRNLPVEMRGIDNPPGFRDLAEQTDNLLATPAQKQAKKDLAFWQATLVEVQKAHGGAVNRLRNARVGADGKLRDGAYDAYMTRLRSR